MKTKNWKKTLSDYREC